MKVIEAEMRRANKQGFRPGRDEVRGSGKSGTGLPHYKTLARLNVLPNFRQVFQCAAPVALSEPPSTFG